MSLQRAQSLAGPLEGRPESHCGTSTCSTSSLGKPGPGLAHSLPPPTPTVFPAFNPRYGLCAATSYLWCKKFLSRTPGV